MKKYTCTIVFLVLTLPFSLYNCGGLFQGIEGQVNGDWKLTVHCGQDANYEETWTFRKDKSFKKTYEGKIIEDNATWGIDEDGEYLVISYENEGKEDYRAEIVQISLEELWLESTDPAGRICENRFEKKF